MGKFKEIMTDIQNLERELKRVVEINQMLVDTINEEDDDIEKLQIKVDQIESILARHIKSHPSSEEDDDVVKKDFDKIIRFDDIQKLQEEVEYLRGVIDGAPEEGHINSIINGLDNRLEKLERILGANFGSIRELELEDKSIQEELTELQEIVRQLSVKMNVLEGVKDFQENVKPTFTCIGDYLDKKYKSARHEAREDFYAKYKFLCMMLNGTCLTEEELMATPLEDWPFKFN